MTLWTLIHFHLHMISSTISTEAFRLSFQQFDLQLGFGLITCSLTSPACSVCCDEADPSLESCDSFYSEL